MAYRWIVQYWTYEQALEMPFGLPCCRSDIRLLTSPTEEDDTCMDTDGRREMECEWLFCFEPGTIETIYPSGELHHFCEAHAPALEDYPIGSVNTSLT